MKMMISRGNPLNVLLFVLLVLGSAQAQEAETDLQSIDVFPELDRQKSSWLLAPGSFLIKDSEKIKKNQGQTLEDVLGNEPGVHFTGGPRSQAQLPQIRGFGSSRVLILADGARQNFQSEHNGRVFLDASFLESAEVIKGPWSSLYGSGALGGVISLQRPTARTYLQKTGQDHGVELVGQVNSAAQSTGGRVTVYGRQGRWEPLLSVHQERASDLRLGGGEILGSSALDAEDFYGSLGYSMNERHRTVLKVGQHGDRGLAPLNPEQESSGVSSETGERKAIKRDFILDHSWVEGPLVDARLRIYAQSSEVTKVRLSDHRQDRQSVRTVGFDSWNHLVGALSEQWQSVFTIGLEYFEDQQRGERDGGELNLFPDAQGSQWGLSVQPQFIWNDQLKLAPGLRYDRYAHTQQENVLPKNEGEQITGRLYAVYEYQPFQSVFVGYGQGYNAPRLQDLYLTGMHFPATPGFPANFFSPSPDLKPERSDSIEIGLKSRWEKDVRAREVNVTVYGTEAQDFIYREVDLVGGTTRQRNLSEKAFLYGVEIEGLVEEDNYGMALTYSQNRGNNKVTKAALPDLPGALWGLRLERFWGAEKAYLVGTDLQYVERQGDVPSTSEPSFAYFTQDIYFQYGLKKKSGGNFGLRANNIFDRSYRKNGSSLSEVGRDLRLQVTWLL